MKKIKYYITFGLLFLPSIASADLATDSGLEEAADATNLIKQRNMSALVAGVINSLLGLLGMLFVVLTIYGGFRWMTAGGNTEQVSQAKNVIKNSTIGLAVVLFSYVIVRTVLTILEGGIGGATGGAVGGED